MRTESNACFNYKLAYNFVDFPHKKTTTFKHANKQFIKLNKQLKLTNK